MAASLLGSVAGPSRGRTYQQLLLRGAWQARNCPRAADWHADQGSLVLATSCASSDGFQAHQQRKMSSSSICWLDVERKSNQVERAIRIKSMQKKREELKAKLSASGEKYDPRRKNGRRDNRDMAPVSRGGKMSRMSDIKEKQHAIVMQLKKLFQESEELESLKAYQEAEEIFANLSPIVRKHNYIYHEMIKHAFAAGRGHRALYFVQTMRKDGIAPSLSMYHTVFTGMREIGVSAQDNSAIVRAVKSIFADFEELLDAARSLERRHGGRDAAIRSLHRETLDRVLVKNGKLTPPSVSYPRTRNMALLHILERIYSPANTTFCYGSFLEAAGLPDEADEVHARGKIDYGEAYDIARTRAYPKDGKSFHLFKSAAANRGAKGSTESSGDKTFAEERNDARRDEERYLRRGVTPVSGKRRGLALSDDDFEEMALDAGLTSTKPFRVDKRPGAVQRRIHD